MPIFGDDAFGHLDEEFNRILASIPSLSERSCLGVDKNRSTYLASIRTHSTTLGRMRTEGNASSAANAVDSSGGGQLAL